MPELYTREVSRANPILFLFLLDQSFSMEETFGGQPVKKKEQLAKAINLWLRNMCVKATREGGVRDYMHVGVIGYRTDDTADSIIESAFGEASALGDRAYVPISEIYDNPRRVEDVVQTWFDDETGEEREKTTKVPVWVDPVAQGGTPMCEVLEYAGQVIEHWVSDHQSCHPPIVVHITDGESQDGDPIPNAAAIREMKTDDGSTLVFNCHLSNAAADQILFPSNIEVLPAGGEGDAKLARDLFNMSSQLPEPMFKRATSEGFELLQNAAGMVFNADMVSLLQFLDMGTRVALR